jgi:hypothetical protein
MQDIIVAVSGALFRCAGTTGPSSGIEDFYVEHTLDAALTALWRQVRRERTIARQEGPLRPTATSTRPLVRSFAAELPKVAQHWIPTSWRPSR